MKAKNILAILGCLLLVGGITGGTIALSRAIGKTDSSESLDISSSTDQGTSSDSESKEGKTGAAYIEDENYEYDFSNYSVGEEVHRTLKLIIDGDVRSVSFSGEFKYIVFGNTKYYPKDGTTTVETGEITPGAMSYVTPVWEETSVATERAMTISYVNGEGAQGSSIWKATSYDGTISKFAFDTAPSNFFSSADKTVSYTLNYYETWAASDVTLKAEVVDGPSGIVTLISGDTSVETTLEAPAAGSFSVVYPVCDVDTYRTVKFSLIYQGNTLREYKMSYANLADGHEWGGFLQAMPTEVTVSDGNPYVVELDYFDDDPTGQTTWLDIWDAEDESSANIKFEDLSTGNTAIGKRIVLKSQRYWIGKLRITFPTGTAAFSRTLKWKLYNGFNVILASELASGTITYSRTA